MFRKKCVRFKDGEMHRLHRFHTQFSLPKNFASVKCGIPSNMRLCERITKVVFNLRLFFRAKS